MLTPDVIDDIATITLSKFKRLKYVDISRDYQFLTASKIFKEKRIKYQGGKDIRWFLKTNNTGNARYTSLFDQDQTGRAPLMDEAVVPWRMITTNYSYDVREPDFQSDEEMLIDQLKVLDVDARGDMMELVETGMWGAPSSSTDNVLWGIPLWIQKDTTSDGAFNGGNPSGFSGGVANIDSTQKTNWRNWAGGYTNVELDDLVEKAKDAIRNTKFVAYVPGSEELRSGDWMCEMFTTQYVVKRLERIAEERNDNHGVDVAKYMNSVTIAGHPISWVPYLDANTTDNPVYGVNWKSLRPFIHKNKEMRRTGPDIIPGQHNVRTVHFDSTLNIGCENRREQFVLSQ